MPRNPIVQHDNEELCDTEEKTAPRDQYDPVLQRYPDEIEKGKEMDDYDRAMEKINLQYEHQELYHGSGPTPPDGYNKTARNYFKSKERQDRTREWMPAGRPKGGRSYVEKAASKVR